MSSNRNQLKNKSLEIGIFHLGFFFSGGGEKLVLEEAAGLSKLGHKVSIYVPVIDKKSCFPELIKKAQVHSLFFPPSFSFPLRDFIAIFGSVILTPFRFFQFSKYDVFLGANQPGPLICYCLSLLLRKPYVIYLAQPTRLIYPRRVDLEAGFGKGSFNLFFYLARLFQPFIKLADKISIKSANAILVNGSYMAKIISKVYGVKVITCPAGCYPQRKIISQIERQKGIIKIGKLLIKKPYLLLTNRHYPQKKFEYAIETLARIKDKFPRISLVITGAPTKYTGELMKLIQKYGLRKRIHFTGLVSEKEITKLYSQAVLYLYTSPEEDFGMGVIEAMAVGTPVVAWDNAGPKTTVVNGETGYLATRNSLVDFTSKVSRLLADPQLAMSFGLAGQQRSRKFSYKVHHQILAKTLTAVVKDRG